MRTGAEARPLRRRPQAAQGHEGDRDAEPQPARVQLHGGSHSARLLESHLAQMSGMLRLLSSACLQPTDLPARPERAHAERVGAQQQDGHVGALRGAHRPHRRAAAVLQILLVGRGRGARCNHHPNLLEQPQPRVASVPVTRRQEDAVSHGHSSQACPACR